MTALIRKPAEIAVHSAQLAQLTAWLESSPGRAVLLRGCGGDGRSELTDALVQNATRGDAVVLAGRVPTAGGKSFQGFAEIAQQAMRWAEECRVPADITDPIFSVLAPVFQGIVVADVPALDQRLAFFEAFRELLVVVASRVPMLLVVRDFENADADSLELASYLVDELFGPLADATPRSMLLFVVRDDDATPMVAEAIDEMAEVTRVESMRLDPLSLDDVRSYVQSPHVLQRLLSASNGSPRGLEALLGALPNNVEELFHRRLEALGAPERKILDALAVSGQAASATTLAAVLEQSAPDTAQTLNRLRAERVVDRRITTGELLFTFARARDRELTHDDMPSEHRARLHGAWANHLADRSGRPDFGLLAYHQLRSTEPHRGVAMAIRAAESHALAGALHAAMDVLEQALPFASEKLRASVLQRLCELAPLTGSPRRALAHIEEWKRLLPADERAPALTKEAELLNATGAYRQALSVLDEIDDLDAAGEVIASEAHYHLGDAERASACCRRGLAMVGGRDDETSARIRFDLLNQRGKIALAAEDLEGALEHFEDALTFAERCGSGSDLARARLNVGTTCVRLGDHDRAELALEAGIDDARRAGNLAALAFATMNLGALHHQCGDLGRAIEVYVESRSLFRRLGNRTQLARVLLNLANVHHLIGDLQRADVLNQEALRLARVGGVERVIGLAMLLDGCIRADLGDADGAERSVRDAIRKLRGLGSQRPVEALLKLTELFADRGDLAEATHSLEQLHATIDSNDRPTHRARARLVEGRLRAMGGAEDALDELEAARVEIESVGSRILVRDTELATARAALAVGRMSRARIHADAAQEIHDDIALDLPEGLRATFRDAPVARRIAEVRRGAASTPARQRNPAPTSFQPEWSTKYATIVGSSAKIGRLFRQLDRVAASDSTVLIHGESGTGKELVAEALHRQSHRHKGPFIKLNCGALVESLLLSELFGHERGAFTGAHQRKLGRFEIAKGGTLFLDEIGDIAPATQVALLRVLQEREFERVGGGKPIAVDARVVFATNRNLAEMVREGSFREDLYYRLKGVTIELPPLRERPEDIDELVRHFLGRYALETDTPSKRMSPQALEAMCAYAWPGNVRELEHVVRSGALFTEGDVVDVCNLREVGGLDDGLVLPTHLTVGDQDHGPPPLPAPSVDAALFSRIFEEGVSLPELKREIEHRAIVRALRFSRGNISRAATALGMKRPRLSQIINSNPDLKALCQGGKR